MAGEAENSDGQDAEKSSPSPDREGAPAPRGSRLRRELPERSDRVDRRPGGARGAGGRDGGRRPQRDAGRGGYRGSRREGERVQYGRSGRGRAEIGRASG